MRDCLVRGVLIVLALGLLPSGLRGQQGEKPYALVEITNGFGTTKQFKAEKAETGDSFIDYAVCGNGARLPLRVTPTTIVCIPVWDFTQAEKTTGTTVRVSLTSGGFVEGTPFGSLLSDDRQANGLASLQKLRVVKIHEGYKGYFTSGKDQDEMKEAGPVFELSALDKTTARFDLRSPSFLMKYYSTAGYVIGGSNTSNDTRALQLMKGTEELEAPIVDFVTIVLTKAAASGPARVSVTTAAGTVTEGTLSLKAKDSAGVHPTNDWWIGGILQGTTHARVMTSSPSITLRRKG